MFIKLTSYNDPVIININSIDTVSRYKDEKYKHTMMLNSYVNLNSPIHQDYGPPHVMVDETVEEIHELIKEATK